MANRIASHLSCNIQNICANTLKRKQTVSMHKWSRFKQRVVVAVAVDVTNHEHLVDNAYVHHSLDLSTKCHKLIFEQSLRAKIPLQYSWIDLSTRTHIRRFRIHQFKFEICLRIFPCWASTLFLKITIEIQIQNYTFMLCVQFNRWSMSAQL